MLLSDEELARLDSIAPFLQSEAGTLAVMLESDDGSVAARR
ncbi:hypothetical protein PSAB6_370009 [Paraburkholderia sabiae]|jgi:hypothetical protein|nr:hypothetical protein [Paraburkholderia sabiae]CAG9219182.1 hypothetical protein PSAB6_370009 [Paraburkholderia sabiae]